MNRDTVAVLGLIGAMMPAPRYSNDFDFIKFKPAPTKQFSNCPICGKERVNIYNKNGTWKCLKCWNTEEQFG